MSPYRNLQTQPSMQPQAQMQRHPQPRPHPAQAAATVMRRGSGHGDGRQGQVHAGARSGTAQGVTEVVIIQRRLPHYRVPLFLTLKELLAARSVNLRLLYGQPTADEEKKGDSGHIEWAEFLPCRYGMNANLCWQNANPLLKNPALVIMTPENRMLYNLWAQFIRRDFKVGLWGHGANFQGQSNLLRERFKRWIARHSDWWFAYTEASLPHLASSGFPRDRVTILNNAIDTSSMLRLRDATDPARLKALAASLGLHGSHVGIYVGSLYKEKRTAFMLEAALKIREQLPTFEFLIVGDGADRPLVEQFSAAHPWARYLGLRFGQDKVDAMSLAQVVLNPGMVGLSILDSFILETPLVTTDCGIHSPEIAYLKHGENGVMTADDMRSYVDGVVQLLGQPEALARLKAGCAASAPVYTVQNMADNYVDGIVQCLAREPLRGQAGR